MKFKILKFFILNISTERAFGVKKTFFLLSKAFSFRLKDTHREKAPSNKTPALTESANMDIWVVGILNQLFIRGS